MNAETLPLTFRDLLQSKFLRFLFVAGLNTLVGYGIFAVLVLAGLHYSVAGAISTILGVLFNFKSYGLLVFNSHDNWKIFRFVAVYAVTYSVNLGLLWLAERNGISVLLAAAVTLLPMAFFSFLLNRALVYGDRR
jgi:putative flippase GtrA